MLDRRGRIVPVYDLADGSEVSSEASEHSKIVIVETGSETTA